MGSKKEDQLVPYHLISPGWEATYTGESNLALFESNPLLTYTADTEGDVFVKYSMWGFSNLRQEDWSDEIRYINAMQSNLEFLDDDIRKIRQQIAGLLCCDNGVPVTIDEILNAIGTGNLPENPFHPGCWMSGGTRSTQPSHVESMKVIEDVLTGFLDGKLEEKFLTKYPNAKGFIKRTYEWLKSVDGLSELQILLMRRMLLPFELFTKRSEDIYAVGNNCFAEDGEGFKLDKQISELTGLPKIYPNNKKEYIDNLNTISNEVNRELYKICGNITICVAEMSDCHHNTFRIIESCIYSIGTLKIGIPTRAKSVEEKRLGQLLFGYALGLDRWLQGIPHQFLLLDLGHIDLGFNPKNEILRVYAYLGDKRTPVNKWLAACLWYNLALDPSASLNNFTNRHNELMESTKANGINVREWINTASDGNFNNKNNE